MAYTGMCWGGKFVTLLTAAARLTDTPISSLLLRMCLCGTALYASRSIWETSLLSGGCKRWPSRIVAPREKFPKAQRRRARSLAQWLGTCESREEALYRAYTESGTTIK